MNLKTIAVSVFALGFMSGCSPEPTQEQSPSETLNTSSPPKKEVTLFDTGIGAMDMHCVIVNNILIQNGIGNEENAKEVEFFLRKIDSANNKVASTEEFQKIINKETIRVMEMGVGEKAQLLEVCSTFYKTFGP